RLAQEPAAPELLADRLSAARRALGAELVRLGLAGTTEARVVDDALAWLSLVLAGMTNGLVCQRFAAFRRLLDPFRFGAAPAAGGRAAAVLRFGDAALFYKPRSVHGEAIWGDLAAHAIGRALGLDLRTPRVSEHGTFGFMELVVHAPCSTVAAVQRCYRRYGGLLALAHGLGTCDLHHENVIVAGEHPIVVDAETILKGRLGLSEPGRRR